MVRQVAIAGMLRCSKSIGASRPARGTRTRVQPLPTPGALVTSSNNGRVGPVTRALCPQRAERCSCAAALGTSATLCVLESAVQHTADLRIGTAGWSIPGPERAWFPTEGSHLERYAQRLRATEINSSFYRSHKPQTYARWAASVPADFRFAVKLPREITHKRKLVAIAEPLEQFLEEVQHLSDKLGPLLVQLPPSLAFDEEVAFSFFAALRARFAGSVVCEPRHPTWFSPAAAKALIDARIARVAADPTLSPEAKIPGGWNGLTYRRWHGSPVTYSSAYSGSDLDRFAFDLHESMRGGGPHWCIFDNTARGEAAGNARELCIRMLEKS